MRTLPISVVVPTLDRPDRLRACLESIVACSPAPAEVVVSAQGDVDAARDVVATVGAPTLRVVACPGRGIGRGVNHGIHAAAHGTILVTHDDCTVQDDWVSIGAELAAADGSCLFTGRVRAAGNAAAVPTTIDLPDGRSYRVGVDYGVLFPNNMVVRRDLFLELGGFDERLVPAAEDNDLCYRWLRAGLPVRYEPRLVVWHHEWRSHAELERLYVAYAVGEGLFLAKHLRAGDLRVLPYAARYLRWGVKGTAAGLLRGRPRWSDWRQGILRGLPVGLARGLATLGRRPEEAGYDGRRATSKRFMGRAS